MVRLGMERGVLYFGLRGFVIVYISIIGYWVYLMGFLNVWFGIWKVCMELERRVIWLWGWYFGMGNGGGEVEMFWFFCFYCFLKILSVLKCYYVFCGVVVLKIDDLLVWMRMWDWWKWNGKGRFEWFVFGVKCGLFWSWEIGKMLDFKEGKWIKEYWWRINLNCSCMFNDFIIEYLVFFSFYDCLSMVMVFCKCYCYRWCYLV